VTRLAASRLQATIGAHIAAVYHTTKRGAIGFSRARLRACGGALYADACCVVCMHTPLPRGRSSGAEQEPFKLRVVGSNPTGLTFCAPDWRALCHILRTLALACLEVALRLLPCSYA
jgi:hypothetical protein